MLKLISELESAFSKAEASFAKAGPAHVSRKARGVCDLLGIDLWQMTKQKVEFILGMLASVPVVVETLRKSQAVFDTSYTKILLSVLQLLLSVHLEQPWQVANYDSDARNLLYHGFADPFNNPHVSELSKDDADFSLLKEQFCLGNDDTVKDWITIFRVHRPKELERFAKVPKSETGLFYHGTRNNRVASILEDGLLLQNKYTGSNNFYGSGLYFSSSARTSLDYTNYREEHDYGCMFVAELHLGSPKVPDMWQKTEFLSLNNTLDRSQHKVFRDGTVMLSPVVGTIMAVKEQARIKLRYLIHFKLA